MFNLKYEQAKEAAMKKKEAEKENASYPRSSTTQPRPRGRVSSEEVVL